MDAEPTVLLDAFALLAYFLDEPAAPIVQQMLWDDHPALTAIQLAEVIDRLVRVYGVDVEEAEIACGALGIVVLPVDRAVGISAGLLRARHYRSTGRTLSMADAVCAAVAIANGLPVVTADPVLIEVVGAESGRVQELPSSPRS